MVDEQRVELDRGGPVTARRYRGVASPLATLVLAHGAGAGQSSDFMVGFATGLASRGLDVVTFNFPFTERGKKLPDPQPVLEACYRAVLGHVAADRDGGRPAPVHRRQVPRRPDGLPRRRGHATSASRAPARGGTGCAASCSSGIPCTRPASRSRSACRTCRTSSTRCSSCRARKTPSAPRPNCGCSSTCCRRRARSTPSSRATTRSRCRSDRGCAQAAVFAAAQDRIAAWISECLVSATHGGSRPTP